MGFPVIIQKEKDDCGPVALMIVAKYYGVTYKRETICKLCGYASKGTSLYGLRKCAESIGFYALALICSIKDLKKDVPLPAIAFLQKGHFVVIYRISKNYIWISNPSSGHERYKYEDFSKMWNIKSEEKGILLVLEWNENHTIHFDRRQGKCR